MKKTSEVFNSIRFAKLDPTHSKSHKGGSTDDEEHGAVSEVEWNQQLAHQKKRAMQEEKKDKYDEGEYDREGDMAKSDLRSIISNAQRLHDMIDDADNLPEWVQSKITKAEDYISTVANYMTAEVNEAVDKPTGELKDACWKGYTAVGMKMKNGRKVPNCVPTNEAKDTKSMRIIKDLYKKKGVMKEEITIEEEIAGWIAHYNGQKHEIKKHEAKDLYDAKQKAIAHFKAPKSKHGLLSVKPAYNEEVEKPQPKSDHDKWKEEYKKARAAGSSSSNAKARANGAVYEEENIEEGAFKRMATDAEEDKRLGSWRKETPWMKAKDTVTDKSGAKHTPMSRARDLARAAAKKNVRESVVNESRLSDIVREAAEKAKKKKKEKEEANDTFQKDPELSTQIIRND